MTKRTELSSDTLARVSGGGGIKRNLLEGIVTTAKDMAKRHNQYDGRILNGLNGFLTRAQSFKPRAWAKGESLDSLTKEMRENPRSLPTW